MKKSKKKVWRFWDLNPGSHPSSTQNAQIYYYETHKNWFIFFSWIFLEFSSWYSFDLSLYLLLYEERLVGQGGANSEMTEMWFYLLLQIGTFLSISYQLFDSLVVKGFRLPFFGGWSWVQTLSWSTSFFPFFHIKMSYLSKFPWYKSTTKASESIECL